MTGFIENQALNLRVPQCPKALVTIQITVFPPLPVQ